MSSVRERAAMFQNKDKDKDKEPKKVESGAEASGEASARRKSVAEKIAALQAGATSSNTNNPSVPIFTSKRPSIPNNTTSPLKVAENEQKVEGACDNTSSDSSTTKATAVSSLFPSSNCPTTTVAENSAPKRSSIDEKRQLLFTKPTPTEPTSNETVPRRDSNKRLSIDQRAFAKNINLGAFIPGAPRPILPKPAPKPTEDVITEEEGEEGNDKESDKDSAASRRGRNASIGEQGEFNHLSLSRPTIASVRRRATPSARVTSQLPALSEAIALMDAGHSIDSIAPPVHLDAQERRENDDTHESETVEDANVEHTAEKREVEVAAREEVAETVCVDPNDKNILVL